MSSGNGVVAAKALEVLDCQGYDRAKVAAEVGCTERTVRRWEAGQNQPSKRNRTVLLAWIGELLMAERAAASNARGDARVKRLEVAREALMTDADRAERVAFEAEMKAKHAAILAQRQPRSVTYAVDDPFAVVNPDRELAAVEAVFA